MRLFCVISILQSIFFVAQAQTLRQGIQGQVFLVSNSIVDSTVANPSPNAGIKREIIIHELTTLDMASHENGLFKYVPTSVVTSIMSGDDGSFKVKLMPGTYSVFVKESEGLYANLFDQNRINPVVVKPKQYAWVTITIEYPGL
jgi:hypothetical protein